MTLRTLHESWLYKMWKSKKVSESLSWYYFRRLQILSYLFLLTPVQRQVLQTPKIKTFFKKETVLFFRNLFDTKLK